MSVTRKRQPSCALESIQDFLIKLGIKPLMNLLEISNLSLNNVIIRLTKIMNRTDKNWAHFYINKIEGTPILKLAMVKRL